MQLEAGGIEQNERPFIDGRITSTEVKQKSQYVRRIQNVMV